MNACTSDRVRVSHNISSPFCFRPVFKIATYQVMKEIASELPNASNMSTNKKGVNTLYTQPVFISCILQLDVIRVHVYLVLISTSLWHNFLVREPAMLISTSLLHNFIFTWNQPWGYLTFPINLSACHINTTNVSI